MLGTPDLNPMPQTQISEPLGLSIIAKPMWESEGPSGGLGALTDDGSIKLSAGL